jgi:diguanylate cyclase (GGDEF)-like protein
MNSIFRQISQSSNADDWRRFRTSSEQFRELLVTVRTLGFGVQEVALPHHPGEKIVQINDGQRCVCIAEPSHLSPSPFRFQAQPCSVAFSDVPDAPAQLRAWLDDIGNDVPDHHRRDESSVSPLCTLLRKEERMSWLDLECVVLRGMQTANQLDLEGEPLFLSLSYLVRDLLLPSLLEIQLESPSDYWPGRPAGWTWIESTTEVYRQSAQLTPRLQRLLYRRERVLFIEDLSAAPDVQMNSATGTQFMSGLLLPLVGSGKPIGILKLFYTSSLTPLPGDTEALELLRRELSLALDRSRAYLRTQRMATVDGLTNLFNHRFFRDQLRTEYQRATRYQKQMAVIMIDIDEFKGYNDTYGHLAGDRVLAETARTIRSAVRDIDFVARYGGEEFALILPEVDAESGLIVGEKIRKAVEAQRFISEDGEAIGAITVSCGVTDNRDAGSPEVLIERADKALYWVKRHGRNLVHAAADGNE